MTFKYLVLPIMARIVLGSIPPQLDTTALTGTGIGLKACLSPRAIEERLRSKRSGAYVESLRKLDAGGHMQSRDALNAFLGAIRQELPEIAIEHLPVGIVAKCYLGAPHEVHTLDRVGLIIRHYKNFEALPPPLERARSLALHPEYVFVEVYADKLIAVSQNGDTSMVKG